MRCDGGSNLKFVGWMYEQSLDLVPNRASSGGCELSGSFVPRGAGLAALAVTYQEHHIKGSPWQVCLHS